MAARSGADAACGRRGEPVTAVTSPQALRAPIRALLTQTRDAFLRAFPVTAAGVIRLPSQCKPLQSVTSIGYIDAASGSCTFM